MNYWIQLIKKFQQKHILMGFLSLGDRVCVCGFIQEGIKKRVQSYQGILLAHKKYLRNTIMIRRVFKGIGVERIFLPRCPSIQRIEVVRHSKARRAKLYYLRYITGKAARLRERFVL